MGYWDCSKEICQRNGRRVEALRTRVEALEAFARDMLELGRDRCDIDGGDFFDVLEKHGIIAPVPVTEPCSEYGCDCAEMDNIPGDCYRSTLPPVQDAAAVL